MTSGSFNPDQSTVCGSAKGNGQDCPPVYTTTIQPISAIDALIDRMDDIIEKNGLTISAVPGSISITLLWIHGQHAADLDLWITEPSGEEIGYNKPQSSTNGSHEKDSSSSTTDPIENMWRTKWGTMLHYSRVSYTAAVDLEPL